MRLVNRIFVHSSAGNLKGVPKDIVAWQTSPKSKGGKGWSVGGYHIMIDWRGAAHQMYDFEQVTNGVAGYNKNSIHVCLIGGRDGFDHTHEQMCELENQLYQLKEIYPNAQILGHRDISPDKNGNGRIESNEWIKLCPGFDVSDWLKSINFTA